MNKYTIIPSSQQYKSAPAVDQDIDISLNQKTRLLTEFDRSASINLEQVFDNERQACTVFRPTFKLTYLYANTLTGTTNYLPFQYNLYYIDPISSMGSGVWNGFPQYYEFDFYRPDVKDQHISYKAKSAYTYNWTYYISYPYSNDYTKRLEYSLNNTNRSWIASEGIPFVINNSTQNGNSIIQFQCIAPHGLTPGEFVKLSFFYNEIDTFQVYSLGNDLFDSDVYIFNIYNIGYTGTTFSNSVSGTFKRVINPENYIETTSKYYVRQHKIITNVGDCIMTKAGFEKNLFTEEKKLEYSSITPNNVTRISQKTSSNSYNVTLAYDLNLLNITDNQKRPLTEIFLTVINKGYTGYFNKPSSLEINKPYVGIGLKQGWQFNINPTATSWWQDNNTTSNTNIKTSGYTLTSGVTKNFYYNQDLMSGDTIDGDFCEWNDYEQLERVISPYFHKLKFNQNVFQTSLKYTTLETFTDSPIETSPIGTIDTNAPGYYYQPHQLMRVRVFSDYVETGDLGLIQGVPSYSYFSNADQQFRWRDLYTYGFIDNLQQGVDYPFLNSAHYPYSDVNFRLIPEGINYNENLLGINFPIKPLIDGCE